MHLPLVSKRATPKPNTLCVGRWDCGQTDEREKNNSFYNVLVMRRASAVVAGLNICFGCDRALCLLWVNSLCCSLCYCSSCLQIEGFQPEWYISTMIYSRDIPFRKETLEMCYLKIKACAMFYLSAWGRYHGGRRPSSDGSFHSPTVISSSALDKPNIMKRYHRRRTCSHTSPRRSLTMVTLHDTRFVECRWWNDGWTVKTVVT